MSSVTTFTAVLVLDTRNETGESPVWSVAEEALYWVDIPACRIHRWSGADRHVTHWDTPEAITCLAPTQHANQWLVGAETGIARLTLSSDNALEFECVALAKHAQLHMRFNDGRCDRQGRFWAGTIAPADAAAHAAGKLYRFDATHGLSAPVISARTSLVRGVLARWSAKSCPRSPSPSRLK